MHILANVHFLKQIVTEFTIKMVFFTPLLWYMFK